MDPTQQNQMQPMPQQQPQQAEQANVGQQQDGKNFISQEEHADPRDQAYETAFKDSAYNVFSLKYPDLVQNIVTFKVIKSSIDQGEAIGAFIINNQGETFYVPVVMSDNQMKPLELLYYKKADRFVPFNREWVQILLSSGAHSLGEGSTRPPGISSDVDITGLIRPPMEGRMSYASDESIDHLAIIREAGNDVKDSYRSFLKTNFDAMKFAFETWDGEEILAALQRQEEKVAEEEADSSGSLAIVTFEDSVETIKETFGSLTKHAMHDIATAGFAFKDTRAHLGSVMTSDMKITLEEPANSSTYAIYTADGHHEPALIIVNPEDLNHRWDDGRPEIQYKDRIKAAPGPDKSYLVIRENGEWFTTHKIIATPIPRSEFKGSVGLQIFGDKKAGTATKTNFCFIKVEGEIVKGTSPVYVELTEATKDGKKKFLIDNPFGMVMAGGMKGRKVARDLEVLHAATHSGKILKPSGSNLTVVPECYRAVRLGDNVGKTSHLTSASEVLQYVQTSMTVKGSKTVKVASTGGGEYAVNGRPSGELKDAAVKLATDFLIPMESALRVLEKLPQPTGSAEYLIYPGEKRASVFSPNSSATQMSPELVQQATAQGQGQGQGQPQQPGQAPGQPSGPGQAPGAMQDMGMLQNGLQMKDPNMYSLGVLNSLSNNPDIRDLLSIHSPSLEKAMDSLGRMLITVWIKGTKAKESMGEETFYTTEEALRSVFKGLGSLLVKINRQTSAMPEYTGI